MFYFHVSSSILETCFKLLPLAGQFFAPTVAWKGVTCMLRGEEDEVKMSTSCVCALVMRLGVLAE